MRFLVRPTYAHSIAPDENKALKGFISTSVSVSCGIMYALFGCQKDGGGGCSGFCKRCNQKCTGKCGKKCTAKA